MSTINEIYEKLDGIIDKKDFLKRVEEKIEKMNGLCDEQTAAMLVSKDLGVTETEGDSTISSIKAGDNVNVSAKVVSLLGIREFNRNDGSVGIVGNIKVADETSAIRVTLWDEKAELIKANKIKEGSVYQIQGYAKDGYSGIEINLGRTGSITEIEKNITVVMNSLEIKDVIDGMGDINLKAKVLNISEMRMFNKKDGSVGRVCNLEIGDITGKIRVTLWDDKTDITEELEVDDSIEILNAYARENNFSQKVELQIGDYGIIKKIDETVEFKETFTEIKDVIDGMGDINLKAKVLNISEMRMFNKKDGSVGRVCNLEIGDITGKIRVTLWDDKTDITEELEVDDSIEILNAYARENNFSQKVELQIGDYGIIKKIDETVEFKETFTEIIDIVPDSAYSIEGEVSGKGDIREFSRDDGTPGIVANINVSDNTGDIRVTLWGAHANIVHELEIGAKVEIIDAYAKSGFNDETELSLGERGKIKF